jgi:tight adherence protein C
MDNQFLFILVASTALGLITLVISQLVFRPTLEKLRDRLKGGGKFTASASAVKKKSGLSNLAQRVGQLAAEPFMPKTREKQSGIRQKLAEAGIYSSTAVRAMTGAKVICTGVGVLLGYFGTQLIMDMGMFGLGIGGLLGYMAPKIWLSLRIKANQKLLNYGLADALDLMVVCVEAGLTVDGAMQRVGQEMAVAHPALARELTIAHMETRVGLSRTESLKNLGTRTGNEALKSLSAMLVQAERFGTSVAQALRVHSDALRSKRQLAAEESAAKASVKMTFPLVLFIFPATFIVLAGPTVINLMNSELFK